MREETASVLLRLSRSLSEVSSVDDIARKLAAAVPAISGADQATVAIVDEDTNVVRMRASAGFPIEMRRAAEDLSVALDEFEAGMPAAALDGPMVLHRTEATGMVAALMDQFGISVAALVPLRLRDRVLGMVSCGWRDRAPDDVDVLDERLRSMSDQAATALENAVLVEQIRHQALHDALTSLPNQVLFEDRVTTELTRAARNQLRVAVGVLDLDRFKTVNDSLGHRAGDALLVQVASRIGRAMRAQDTIARMGGDEFTLLLPDIGEDGERVVAERILEAFVQPFEIDGHRLRVSPSIGLSVYPDDGATFEQLLKGADVAMYRAKERGRNTWACYTSGMAERAYDRLTLETDLYRALQRRELRVAYQPIVRVSDGAVVASEALVRWAHPTLGLLVPEDFLPIAEEVGLMAEIDGWVLRQACLELGSLTDAAARHGRVTVNLSSRTLLHPALERLVGDALAAGGLEPDRLVLEIDEQVAADRVSAFRDGLAAVRKQGVRVALDDFGAGYSTLSRLEELPVDQLKVDSTFLATIENANAPAPVAEAIVAMGHGLGLEVVAEGVETPVQLAFATRVGFDAVQGWLVGRPATSLDYEGARSRTA
jgi:diguanylate cyclase (GGDEF)-like protein